MIPRQRNDEIHADHYGARALLNKLDIISCLTHNSSRALVTSEGGGAWVDAGPEEDNIGHGRTQEEGWAREPSGTVRHLTSPRALHRFAPPRRPFLITVSTWLELDPPFAVCPGVDADNFAPEISRVTRCVGKYRLRQTTERRLIFLCYPPRRVLPVITCLRVGHLSIFGKFYDCDVDGWTLLRYRIDGILRSLLCTLSFFFLLSISSLKFNLI